MQLSRKFIALFVVAILVASFAAFVLGVRVGAGQFFLSDAQYRASILSGELKLIKAGKVQVIANAKELELDGELANYGRYMESHFTWLFPELTPEDDQAIRRAVTYRLDNPYKSTDFSKAESFNPGTNMNDKFVLDLIEGQKWQKHYMQKTMDAYGDKLHNRTLQGTPDRRP